MIRILFIVLFFSSCINPSTDPVKENLLEASDVQKSGVELVILGTIQDAGSPHIGCTKSCCQNLTMEEVASRQVSCLGIIDYDNKETYLLDATPDITTQLSNLQTRANWDTRIIPNGIFLSHAHIGHYTGLMYFGREALGGSRIPTYVMPRMMDFLISNGPWSQLVKLENIDLIRINEDVPIALSDKLRITPFKVPHRDEFSETVGYRVKGPNKELLFIPDIDKWELWDRAILNEIKKVDYAFLDATFYSTAELGHRDPTEIPHPLVEESLSLFSLLSLKDRNKIYFIHLNHTNPLLDKSSKEYAQLLKSGCNLATFNSTLQL